MKKAPPQEWQQYVRINHIYYRNYFLHYQNRQEHRLIRQNKAELRQDFGRDFFGNVKSYIDFVNVPSHTNYQQVINEHWNTYHKLTHQPTVGSWENIEKLLRHVFREHYEMILDYLTVLYQNPTQKLPVIVLLSSEQGTGKSAFINLLHAIFQRNVAPISNSDLLSDFNAHFIGALLAVCEESFLDKKEMYNKIKHFSTAKTILRHAKGIDPVQIDCNLHFVFCSNHENDFIKIDKHDRRLWIRIVLPIEPSEYIANHEQKIQNEIPAFVHHLATRQTTYMPPNGQTPPLFFATQDFQTEAFEKVVRSSEPTVIKEIREYIEDYFNQYEHEHELKLTAKNIKEIFTLKEGVRYIFEQVQKHIPQTLSEKIIRYDYNINNTRSPKVPGKPFIFQRTDFVEDEQNDNQEDNEIPF